MNFHNFSPLEPCPAERRKHPVVNCQNCGGHVRANEKIGLFCDVCYGWAVLQQRKFIVVENPTVSEVRG